MDVAINITAWRAYTGRSKVSKEFRMGVDSPEGVWQKKSSARRKQMIAINNIVNNWKMPEKTIKLVHVSSGKTVWLNCPSDAYELGHISDETKSAWKMFNVYPNGFEAEMGL